MGREIRRQAPALTVACIALVAALSGTVYAAAKSKINGKAIKVKSLPGNRLAIGSLPGNRLAVGSLPGSRLAVGSLPGSRLEPGTIPADRLAPGAISGAQIDPATLGQVPSAVQADFAISARDAQTALHAVSAIDAVKVNGHTAGCQLTNRYFAGACWQAESSQAAVSAPAAALSCATQGGELPGALALAAFAGQPGIALAPGDEWTSDIPSISGPDVFAVITVSAAAQINSVSSTNTRKYRCVIPLVS